jgi:hypothetical protein
MCANIKCYVNFFIEKPDKAGRMVILVLDGEGLASTRESVHNFAALAIAPRQWHWASHRSNLRTTKQAADIGSCTRGGDTGRVTLHNWHISQERAQEGDVFLLARPDESSGHQTGRRLSTRVAEACSEVNTVRRNDAVRNGTPYR